MNRKELREAERETVSLKDFQDALESILLKPISKKSRWENREPTMKELSAGFKLNRQK